MSPRVGGPARLTPGDWVLMAALAAGSLGLGWRTWFPSARAGGSVVVYLDGREVGRAALSHDAEMRVDGRLGRMKVQILHNRVRVEAAPCARKLCEHMGWISRAGQSVACVPSHALVVIQGEGEYDTVVF